MNRMQQIKGLERTTCKPSAAGVLGLTSSAHVPGATGPK